VLAETFFPAGSRGNSREIEAGLFLFFFLARRCVNNANDRGVYVPRPFPNFPRLRMSRAFEKKFRHREKQWPGNYELPASASTCGSDPTRNFPFQLFHFHFTARLYFAGPRPLARNGLAVKLSARSSSIKI